MVKFEDFFQEVNDFVSKCWTEVYSECSYPEGSLKRSVLDDAESRSRDRPLKSLPELIINFNEPEWVSYIKPNSDGKKPVFDGQAISDTIFDGGFREFLDLAGRVSSRGKPSKVFNGLTGDSLDRPCRSLQGYTS